MHPCILTNHIKVTNYFFHNKKGWLVQNTQEINSCVCSMFKVCECLCPVKHNGVRKELNTKCALQSPVCVDADVQIVCVFSGGMSDCPSCDRYVWLTLNPNVSIVAPQRQNHHSAVTIWIVKALLGWLPRVPDSKTLTKNTTFRMLLQKHQ